MYTVRSILYILADVESRGIVQAYMDTVIIGNNIDDVFIGEVVQFQSKHSGLFGIVMNIEPNEVKIVLLKGEYKLLKSGDYIYRTHKFTETKSGFGVLGRVCDPMGDCLNKHELGGMKYLIDELFNLVYVKTERNAPNIIEREPVTVPVFTGINAIDTLIPIGAGQRELIVGDLGTGKTTLAITFIMNQRRVNDTIWRKVENIFFTYKHLYFIPSVYVVVGGKRSEQSRIKRLLEKNGVLEYTTMIFTSADSMPGAQYLAPYSGCAIGEWYRDNGYRALVVYDDLSNHATAYRQLSLLLRRPPGREAYPGDIFYIHARLLERAAQLNKNIGGGSLTAFPIVTTKAGDISGYIPTNVISITDGQIVLNLKLANQGLWPAIDLNTSVSRIGSNAQVPALKSISKLVKVEYSLYRRYAGVEKLGGDIPANIVGYINRGKKMVNFFTQEVYETDGLYKQVLILFSLVSGYSDTVLPEVIQYYFSILQDNTLLDQYLDSNLSWIIHRTYLIETVLRCLDFKLIEKQLITIYKKFIIFWNLYFNKLTLNFKMK